MFKRKQTTWKQIGREAGSVGWGWGWGGSAQHLALTLGIQLLIALGVERDTVGYCKCSRLGLALSRRGNERGY